MATVDEEFASPLNKVRRARIHIAEFENALIAYTAGIETERIIEEVTPGHPHYLRWLRIYEQQCDERGIWAKSPPHEDSFAHRIHFTFPPKSDMNYIASDALQNLRQALDHAACACARLMGRTHSDTYFPLVDAGEDIDEAIKKKARKVPPSIKDIIRNCAPGGGLLWDLHKLGVKDKHALTCEMGKPTARSFPHFIKASAEGWIAAGFFGDEWDAVSHDLVYALTGSPVEVNYKFDFHVEIRFDTSGIIATKPALSVLNELADTVDRILGEFSLEMKRLLV